MKNSASLRDRLFAYLRRHTQGVPARTLVEEVFRVSGADEAMCRRLVRSAAAGDPRFAEDDHGFWRAVSPALAEQKLSEAAFTVTHVMWAPTARGGSAVVGILAQRIEALRFAAAAAWRVKRTEALASPAAARGAPAGRARPLADALAALREFGRGTVWAAREARELRRLFQVPAGRRPAPLTEPELSLGALLADLEPDQPAETLADLAARCGLPLPDEPDGAAELRVIAETFLMTLARLQDAGARTVADALARQRPEREPVDFSRYAFDEEFLRSLPESPGVYVMKDGEGRVIYVGKAKNLRRRVRGYFGARRRRDDKTRRLLERVRSIEVETTPTELEALVLEARRIEEWRPALNRQVRVHTRRAGRAGGERLALVAPGEEGGADVWLTWGGVVLERLQLTAPRLDAAALAARIEAAYAGEPPQGEPDAVRELAARWIESARKRTIALDLDLCADAADAARLMVDYARDILTNQPRAFRV